MNKHQAKFELLARLQELGFTYAEACELRRIEMTLHRWGELECGDGNDYASWAIFRDETTDKPFMVTYPHVGKSRRRPIPDRESGALKRLGRIIIARNLRSDAHVIPYHQTDPRGCALYILRASDLSADTPIDQIYTRGLAVAA